MALRDMLNSFVVGSGGEKLTPQQVAERRARAAAKAGRPVPGEGHWAAALNQGLRGFVEGRDNRRADSAEAEGIAGAQERIAALLAGAGLGGGSSLYASSQSAPRPLEGSSVADDTMAALGKPQGGYRQSLIGTESGGNWGAQNSEIGAGGKAGHFGRVQFGQARLQEAMDAGAIPQGTTPEQFMASPELQVAAENWHFGDLERQLSPLVGSVVGGKPLDLGALVAMGHLGGAGGAKKYVSSGGAYNPSDSFGTSLSDYASTHGGAGGSQVTRSTMGGAAQGGGADIAALLAAAADPWVMQQAGPVVNALLGQQMGRQDAQYQAQMDQSDPMYQAKLQQAQMELDAMRNPPAAQPDWAFDNATGQYYDKNNPQGGAQAIPGFTPKETGPLVTVNNNPDGSPSDDSLRKKLMEGEGVAWGESLKAGQTASGMKQDMQLLDEVIKLAPQGPVSGRLAQMFPGVSDAAGVFQSVVKRIAPSLRVEGSGSQSDIEYNGFLQSLPALSNRPEANRAISQFLQAKAQINMERANIVSKYQSNQMTHVEARDAMAKLDSQSIMTPDMQAALGGLGGGDGADVDPNADFLNSLGLK